MKTLLSFILLVFCLNLSAQKKDDPVRKTITELYTQLSNRNVKKLKLYCANDIQILESGRVWNLDTLVKKTNQNKSVDFKRVNKINFVNVHTETNTAWATYNNRADIVKDGLRYKIHWLETAILTKDKKSWRVKVLHSTLVKREQLSVQ